MTKQQQEEELQRWDNHGRPTKLGYLTVDKDGLIKSLCASPYPIPVDEGSTVVSSFRKDGEKLIFEKPSLDIAESINSLREKTRDGLKNVIKELNTFWRKKTTSPLLHQTENAKEKVKNNYNSKLRECYSPLVPPPFNQPIAFRAYGINL